MILFLLAAIIWTAVCFLAYRDWRFALEVSAAAWLVFAGLWIAVRRGFAGARAVSRRAGKSRSPGRRRVAVAGIVTTASLAIFFFSAPVRRWLEERMESASEAVSVGLRSARGFSSKDRPRPEAPGNEGLKTENAGKPIPRNTETLWAVQMGAFRSRENALQLAKRLRREGYEARVVRAKIGDGELYRIKVGQFRSKEEAEGLLGALKDKEAYRTAFVARV